MKYFWIPAVVLAALLAASFWNARQVETAVEPWREEIGEAVASAEGGDWDEALRLIRDAREGWYARHSYFHVVIAHDELDKVDALFAEAESFAVGEDMSEFRAETAELSEQLSILIETQKLTVRNVL